MILSPIFKEIKLAGKKIEKEIELLRLFLSEGERIINNTFFMADANNLHNYIKGLKKNLKVNKKEGEEKRIN